MFSSTILHIFTLGDPTTFFGVKRSKKGARVHQKGTLFKWEAGRPPFGDDGLVGPRDLRFWHLRGPSLGAPKQKAKGPLEKKCLALGPRAFGGSLGGPPGAHRAKFRAPGTFLKKIPLAIYLNGFGLAVSWTRFARVGSSRNWNICLERDPLGRAETSR